MGRPVHGLPVGFLPFLIALLICPAVYSETDRAEDEVTTPVVATEEASPPLPSMELADQSPELAPPYEETDRVADPHQLLRLARHAYTFGDYPVAIENLDQILNPRVLLREQADIVEALEMWGLATFYEGDQKSSRAAFIRLLTTNPDHRLDPLVVPPPAVEHLESIRQQIEDRLKLVEEEKRVQAMLEEMESLKARQTTVVERHTMETPLLAELIPFGVGQLVQGRKGWGSIFFASQLSMLGLNMGSFWAVERMRGNDGYHASEDLELTRNLQKAQVASFITLCGLAIWGVVDALSNRPAQRQEVHTYTVPAGTPLSPSPKFSREEKSRVEGEPE